jgi:hypothetical protein
MKKLLILPVAIALLAGCAASNDSSRQTPQANAACADLSGSAYLECQKRVAPATRSADDTFKMVKPKPANGGFRGGMNNGSGGGATK